MTGAAPVAPLAALARRPAADPVLCWPGGSLTAGELRARIAARAAALTADFPRAGPLGIATEDRVEALIGVLAGLSLGRPVLPLDSARTAAHAQQPGGWTAPVATGERAAAELWVPTSGTTGPARVARLPASALDAHVAASSAVLPRLGPGDRWLICLPMHTIGALAAAWRALSAGASVALLARFDAAAARTLMAEGVTHVSVVPAMIGPLAEVDAPAPRGLRCLLSGGGPLGAATAQEALKRGWPLWQAWGMTETCSHVAAGPVDAAWAPGLVGRPLPGAELSVEPGTGRVRIAGPMVMAGYLDAGAAAGGAAGAGLEPDGSFLSHDAGAWAEDGRLRLLGRADEVIVSGGVNIHPEAVEEALERCPGVDEAGVTGRPDPRWGALVVALYAGEISPAALESWARAHLPTATRPRHFRRVARLPRNAMGKLLRRELAELGLETQPGSLG